MKRALTVGGLALLVVGIFFALLVNYPGRERENPAIVTAVLAQTAQAFGGFLAIVAAVLLLHHAAGSPSVGQVLSTMIAFLGGVVLLRLEWVVVVVFGTIGLVYAAYVLLAAWRGAPSGGEQSRSDI